MKGKPSPLSTVKTIVCIHTHTHAHTHTYTHTHRHPYAIGPVSAHAGVVCQRMCIHSVSAPNDGCVRVCVPPSPVRVCVCVCVVCVCVCVCVCLTHTCAASILSGSEAVGPTWKRRRDRRTNRVTRTCTHTHTHTHTHTEPQLSCPTHGHLGKEAYIWHVCLPACA